MEATMSYFFVSDRKSFYYRSHIPRPLRRLLKGRREVWRSLFCTDKDLAKLRAASWDRRTLHLYMTLRKQGDRMTEAQREALVSEWLDAELEYAEDCRAIAGRISEAKLQAQLEGLSIMQEEAAEDLTGNDYRRIEKAADELLKVGGLPALDHDSADFGRLCRRLLQAKYEYARIDAKQWNGQVPSVQRPTVHKRSSDTSDMPSPPPSSAVAAATKPSQGAGPLFTEAVEGFLRENPRAERSTRQLKSELQRFLTSIGGDRAVGTISKPDCLKYKDSLLKQEERGLHLNTVNNRLTTLACIFNWCEGQGHIPEHANPAKGIQLNAKAVRKAKRPRKLFTDEQLVMIFGSERFKSLRVDHPAHYWTLLIDLFTACRREESAQLHVADILEEDGIPYFNITSEGEGQSLKNAEHSTRRVPIHESLLKLGFMAYVQKVKAAAHTRLFYQVSKGRNTYADAAGKVFSRLVRKLGMTDKGLVLHSLRHGGITKLTDAGCPAEVARMLTGHAEGDVHGKVYLHKDRIRLSVLRDGINRLRYDQVVEALLRS
jgi:integrase